MIFAFARYVIQGVDETSIIANVDRDGGLPASRFFATVHPTLQLPLNALILTVVVVIIFGCIFLGSTSAFNAIISAAVVALDLSYAMPILVNCLQGRRALPERKWKMPNAIGWAADMVIHNFFSRLPDAHANRSRYHSHISA